MADKTVIVEVQYDTAEAVKNVNKYTEAIEGAKVEQARLKAELEAGKISQKDYSIAVEQSKTNQAKANTERKAAINLLSSEKGSINEVKAEIKRLTLERDKLNRTTDEGKKLEKEYNAQLEALQGSLRRTGTESKGFLGTLTSMPGPIGGIVSGMQGMTKAALAFIATPLGAVMAIIGGAVAGLVAVFKSFAPLLDKIAQGAAAVSAAFNWLKQSVVNLVTGQEAHTESMKEAIKAAIALKKAEQDLEEAVIALTVADAKSKRQIDELLLQSKDRTKSEKERIALIDEALKVEETAYKRRKEIADEELRIAIGKITTGRQFTKQEIANLKERGVEYAFELQNKKLIKDEEIQALADALIKQEDIQGQSISIREKAINRQNALEEKADEAANKRAEALQKIKDKEAEAEKARQQILDEFKRTSAQNQLQDENDLSDELRKIREQDAKELADIEAKQVEIRGAAIVEMMNLKEQDLINDAKTFSDKANAQKAQAESEKQSRIDASLGTNEELELIEYEHNARLIEIEAEYQENIRAQRQAALDQALADMQQIIASSQEMSDARVTIGLDAFTKLSTINWSEVKSAKDGFMAIGQAAQGLTGLITAGHEKEAEIFAAQKAKELAAVEGNKEATDLVNKKYAKKEQQLKKKQFDDDKKKAIIDASIATALAVIKGLSSGLPMPGILMAALAAVTGAVTIASIASQQYTPTATYAKGGVIVDGPSHSQGGVDVFGDTGQYFGNVQGGELMSVLNKDATSEIAAYSNINQSIGRGVSFSKSANGYYENGGVMESVDIERNIDAAIARTPIYVKVGDIQTGMTNVEQSKQVGVI